MEKMHPSPLRKLSLILIGMGISLVLYAIFPLLSGEAVYFLRRFHASDTSLGETEETPVSSDFGLVINKLGVNAPIVKDVGVSQESLYLQALESGVAHARGSALPGEGGLIYLFAHSSLNYWALGRYATVFNLLNKLEENDSIVIYYKNHLFKYQVTSKRIIPGFSTLPINWEGDSETLILQTCYPPGATLSRLIVTAIIVTTE